MNRTCPPCTHTCRQGRDCDARAVPYITTPAGIRIGSAWQPPAPRPDADAEQLQGALLWEKPPAMDREDKLVTWACVLAFIACLAFVVQT